MFGLLATISLGKIFTILGLIGFGVIVTGPLFSLSASGQLGKSLVYSEWNGRKYVREYVIPSNPNSLAQIFQRTFLGALSRHWTTSDPTPRATWQSIADANEYSTFNAYCATNLDAEQGGAWPALNADGTGDDGAAPPSAATAVGGVNRIDGVLTGGTGQLDTDLLLITLSTDGGANATSETPQRVVGFKTGIADGDTAAYSLTHIPAGTWRLGFVCIGANGQPSTFFHPASAITVTGV